MWEDIEQQLSAALGRDYNINKKSSVGGGCINQAWAVSDGRLNLFVKTNTASQLDMFEAEFSGLLELRKPAAIKVPEPILSGTAGGEAFLVMEYINMGGGNNAGAMGEQLAQMHRHTQDRFGWFRDNTIGATEQTNSESPDWVSFWQQQRLGFQLDLAGRRGIGNSALSVGEELMHSLHHFFDNYTPEASLLHGDLWGGNAGTDRDGNPVIFDPATYYGDRETDIAMTELFGGFGGRFYDAYNATWQLDAGYSARKTLYNAYHILNHYNLFGGGYGSQAETMMQRCLSEIR